MSFLLIFSILILSSSVSLISSTNYLHPLDPLTPSELNLVRTLVRKAYPSSSPKHNAVTFQYVGLDEPDKSAVLKWQSEPKTAVKPPRRALVHARFNKQTLELVVDLSTRSLVSKRVHLGHGFSILTLDEQVEANALPSSYPPFKESIKKRGLNMSRVFCSAFSTGWYGEEKSERVLKVQCYYGEGTANMYLRPIEGIIIVVDLDEMKIVGYNDRIRAPLPKAEGTDFRLSAMKPPFGPRLNAPAMVSPEGPGFKMDGNTIRYMALMFAKIINYQCLMLRPYHS